MRNILVTGSNGQLGSEIRELISGADTLAPNKFAVPKSEKLSRYPEFILGLEAGQIQKNENSIVYADATQAKTILGWEATKTLEDMCTDSYRWQSNNPDGYNK